MQVDQLRVSNQLAQATLNALLFITNAANEAMETFLVKYKGYCGGVRWLRSPENHLIWAIVLPYREH
jgi:hypothetical protein